MNICSANLEKLQSKRRGTLGAYNHKASPVLPMVKMTWQKAILLVHLVKKSLLEDYEGEGGTNLALVISRWGSQPS